MSWQRPAKLCCRCQGHWRFGFNWPEGYVCRSCVTRATKLYGCCPGCSGERLLVGRDSAGEAICVDCAGITTSFTCSTCGREGRTWHTRTCLSCSLERRLKAMLNDGSGRVAPALLPLFDKLVAAANAESVMSWISKPAVRERLSSLALSKTPLSHEGIDTMAGAQGREFLRELLVELGLLPYRDKYLAAFESWRVRRLASIDEPQVAREIALYLAWRHSRDLTVRAEAGRVPAQAANLARDKTDAAVRFLAFLSERGVTLAELRQEDVDVFFATVPNARVAVDFLAFAMAHRRCPRVQLARHRSRSSPGCSLAQLNAIVRRLLEDESIALADRVAGLIVLLFAQLLTRVVALTVDDITEADGALLLSLGEDPVVLPEPVAELVSRYLLERRNMNTTNTTTRYLFPGRRPGEHLIAPQLAWRLRRLGITKHERQGALTHLLNEVPAAVVAKATGYSLGTTTVRASQAGTSWASYVALKRGSL